MAELQKDIYALANGMVAIRTGDGAEDTVMLANPGSDTMATLARVNAELSARRKKKNTIVRLPVAPGAKTVPHLKTTT
jgi:hypothetical protein